MNKIRHLKLNARIPAAILLLCVFVFKYSCAEVFIHTEDISISLRPNPKIPPEKLQTFNAEAAEYADSGAGAIDLEWEAPGFPEGSPTDVEIKDYYIRASTRKVSDFGSIEEWWGGASYQTVQTLWSSPGDEMDFTAIGLVPGSTYYFAIIFADEFGNISEIDKRTELAFSYPGIVIQVNAVASEIPRITDLSGEEGSGDGEVILSWQSLGGDFYRIRYSTYDAGPDKEEWWQKASSLPDGAAEVKGTPQETVVILPLPGATYYMSIKTIVGEGIWETESPVGNIVYVVAGDTVPAAPSGLTLEWIEDDQYVYLEWDTNDEFDIDYYEIHRSKAGGEFVRVSTVSHIHNGTPAMHTYIDDSGLELSRLYNYRVRAVDWAGHQSLFSDTEEVYTGERVVFHPVRRLDIDSVSDSVVTLRWEQVRKGSLDLKGYRIERSRDLIAPDNEWETAGFVYSTGTLSFPVAIEKSAYFYRVRTVSWSGEESAGSMSIDTSNDFNHCYLSADGRAYMKVPYRFALETYPENNDGDTINISIAATDAGDYLTAYSISAERKGEKIKDFIFENTRRGAEISIIYDDLLTGGNVTLSANRRLAIFWHNGVRWVKLGGTEDEAAASLTTYSRRLGKFALGYSSLARSFRLNAVEPKIFTPEESDYRINEVGFYFENPKFEEVTIRIFDVRGRIVRRNLRSAGENLIVWDGKDESGQIVRGGVYIYQVEAGGEVINGTVVIAK